jgi:hypothetical protein
MCRLFALHAGSRDVEADFWLLEAPTSLAVQSEVNADGFGIAALSAEAALLLIRNPVQAAGDRIYRGVARHVEACQFLVHLRYADTGGVSLPNTHPCSRAAPSNRRPTSATTNRLALPLVARDGAHLRHARTPSRSVAGRCPHSDERSRRLPDPVGRTAGSRGNVLWSRLAGRSGPAGCALQG